MTKLLKPSEWPGFPKLEGPADPWWPIQEAGWPGREWVDKPDFMSRSFISYHPEVKALIDAHPLWEVDPITDEAFRRTPDFLAARQRSEAALYIEQEEARETLQSNWDGLESDLLLQGMGPSYPEGPCRSPLIEMIIGLAPRTSTYDAWEEAVDVWVAEIKRAASRCAYPPGTMLWWREPPEITGLLEFGKTTVSWRVYCRYSLGLGPLA